MSSPEAVEIRSYRKVFDLERRLYRIDRLRLNPGGIPVRGVVYFIALLLGIQLLGLLPLSSLLVHMFPWYMSDLALPCALAALLTLVRIEGRPFHLAVRALGRYLNGPRHLSSLRPCTSLGKRWNPTDLVFLPDGSDARFRRLRFTGPGVALVSVPHERAVWRSSPLNGSPRLTLRALPARKALAKGQVIELRRGVCLHVHGSTQAKRRIVVPARRRPAHGRSPAAVHTAGARGRKARWDQR